MLRFGGCSNLVLLVLDGGVLLLTDTKCKRHSAGQSVRLVHHDEPERGGGGADEKDREGRGAAGLRGP